SSPCISCAYRMPLCSTGDTSGGGTRLASGSPFMGDSSVERDWESDFAESDEEGFSVSGDACGTTREPLSERTATASEYFRDACACRCAERVRKCRSLA